MVPDILRQGAHVGGVMMDRDDRFGLILVRVDGCC